MKKFSTMLVLAFVLCATQVFAQSRQISGTVKSADDRLPVIGATVLIEGTSAGAVTNEKGAFEINNVKGAVNLEVSYLGFETKIVPVVATETKVNITLTSSAMGVDVIVVTGLGISRSKKALGYETQELSGDQLTAAGNPSLVTSLQGKISGVQIKPSSGMPGASSQFNIRGARSFTGNNQPLYVIDGMPINSNSDVSTLNSVTGADYSNRALDIDPNDIESLNILKGQAASALYGIRASNGVIVITTKSGKGNKSAKPVISFSNTTSMDVISRMPKVQMLYAQGNQGKFNPNASAAWGPLISELPNDPTYGGNANGHQGMYKVSQLETAGLDPWVTPQAYNNVEDFFKTGFTTNTSASISQATDRFNYSLSLNNTTQNGIIESATMRRSGARLAAETKLGKSWTSGFNGNYSTNKITKVAGANDALLATVYGAPSSYNLKGIPYSTPGDPYRQISYRSLTFNNPYWAMENNEYAERTNRFFGNAFVQFSPDYGWSHNQRINVKYQLGMDSYTSLYENKLEYGHRGASGEVKNKSLTNNSVNSLLTATYSVDILSDLKLDFMLGNELAQTNVRVFDANGQNFNFGGWPVLLNSAIQTDESEFLRDRTVGFFGNLNLSYKDMLFLNVTGREDIVSSMPRNNRSFFYPSVSLSWIFTELPGLKGNNILNYGKIRASYAEVGQAGTYYNNYLYQPTFTGGMWSYAPVSYPIGGVNSYIPYPRVYSPELKPQNTVSYEAGLDLRMFKGILELNYTFSRQNVKDQIFPVPLDPSTGYQEMVMNGGRIHTNVHELFAQVNIIRGKNFDWSVNTNFTKIDNYVDELAPGVESIMLGGFVTPQVRAGVGDKFPVIYGGGFLKDQDGNVVVDDKEYLSNGKKNAFYGLPMFGDDGVIGSVSPNFNLGFGTSFRWKKLTLSATFDYKNGGCMYSGTNGLMNLYGSGKVTEDRTSTFVYSGTIATAYDANGNVTASKPNNIVRGGAGDPNAYESLYSDVLGNIDEAFIYKNDFLKLREVTVGYVFDIRKVKLGVNVFARNILVWTKLPNLDPESSQGNNNMGGAFERLSLPQTSSYGLGINLTF